MVFCGERERLPITSSKRGPVWLFADSRDWTNRVNHIPRREMPGSGEHSLTSRQTMGKACSPDLAALREDLRAALRVNCAVYSTAAKECAVSGVYDGIDALFRDIAH